MTHRAMTCPFEPMNIPRRANIFKVKNPDYKPWNMRDVIEKIGGKDYEEVRKQELEKRKAK